MQNPHVELETSQLCSIWHVELSESLAIHEFLRGEQSLIDRRHVYSVLLNGALQIEASTPMPVLRGQSDDTPYHRKYAKLFTVQQMESHFRKMQHREDGIGVKGPIALLEARCNQAREMDLYDKELVVLKSSMRHMQAQDEIEEGTEQCMGDRHFFSTLVLRMAWAREAEFSTAVAEWDSQCWVLGQTCCWIWDAIRHSDLVDAVAGSNHRRQYHKGIPTEMLSAKVVPATTHDNAGVDYARWNQVFNPDIGGQVQVINPLAAQEGQPSKLSINDLRNENDALKAEILNLQQQLELCETREKRASSPTSMRLTEFSPH